ncbi:MAG: DEAD/DEAH box helicase, partial [Microthrixaceae bacterium]|nr:DEAD/DEAH box helicase [Microthrixaceae bacterium]
MTTRMTADPFSRRFALDGFQLEAAEAIANDENVLVSAPTGSGKTVVAETAISRALQTGLR